MKKLTLEIILFLLLVLLILPAALFIDVLSHEFYHFYKHKGYSEEICLNVKDANAYTVIKFPDYSTKLSYNDNIKNQEERTANRIGKIIALFYSLSIILILISLIHINRK